jgi:hypothetical protein
MSVEVGMVFPAIILFSMSLALTGVSLWFAGKLAPWFLKESFEPPTVRSYFFELGADIDMSKGRVVIALIALAIMLSTLLAITVLVKFGGIALI